MKSKKSKKETEIDKKRIPFKRGVTLRKRCRIWSEERRKYIKRSHNTIHFLQFLDLKKELSTSFDHSFTKMALKSWTYQSFMLEHLIRKCKPKSQNSCLQCLDIWHLLDLKQRCFQRQWHFGKWKVLFAKKYNYIKIRLTLWAKYTVQAWIVPAGTTLLCQSSVDTIQEFTK